MANPIGTMLGAGFGALSRMRGNRRSLHPHGAGFAVTLTPSADPPPLALLRGGPRQGVARLSRAIGLPEPLPDILGLALRFPDAYQVGGRDGGRMSDLGPGRHQDLLLATTGRGRGVRHLLAPARGFTEPTFSSLLPYRAAGRLATIAALPEGSAGTPRVTLADLRAAERADLTFALALASPRGHWHTVAELSLGERLEPALTEELRFDAANAGGGLELAALAGIRHDAYRGSQLNRA